MTTPAKQRPGRILLVEDETAVRDTMRTMLERGGWTVLVGRDGAEGLQLAQDLGYTIDLVVSDIVMPEMSGRRMVREMRAERPHLRILLISGFDTRTLGDDPDMAGIPLLEKPFTSQQLLDAVAAAARP
jgi:two-component system cell cycle sensor histidine kinase/response regulator CckA